LEKFDLFKPILRDLNSINSINLLRIFEIYNKTNGEVWFKNIEKTITNSEVQFVIPINPNNGLITLSLYGKTYTDPVFGTPSFICSEETVIQFYDFTGAVKCSGQKCETKTNNFFNGTLGWLMGYRLPYMNVIENGNVAPAILNLTGPKYLLLSVDDYNQNHVNNSLVSIAQLSNRLKMPEYYAFYPNTKGNQIVPVEFKSQRQAKIFINQYEYTTQYNM
jgi:hypothetical protein